MRRWLLGTCIFFLPSAVCYLFVRVKIREYTCNVKLWLSKTPINCLLTGFNRVPLTKKFKLSATTSPSLMYHTTKCASGIMSRDRATENVRWRDVISSTFPVTMFPPAVIWKKRSVNYKVIYGMNDL